MEQNEIKEGDVVCLKHEKVYELANEFTVGATYPSKGTADLFWFNRETQSLKMFTIHMAALAKVED